MNWLLNSLKRPLTLISGGGVVLVALAVLFGRNWQLNTLLLGILIILFIWILVILYLYERMKAKRNAGLLEKSFKDQMDAQILNTRPDKRKDIDQLKNQFLDAIETLKRSRLGKGRNNDAALYALPWYVVIGPPGAGKTTAIINSGLRFPYGKKHLGGIGGTKNCEWFFSDSAIFLDTAGRYAAITEEIDKAEWFEFLDLLNKYRKNRAITGVIVGVSIPDIIKKNEDELERHAIELRSRVDELIQKLGVRFPVYLVFTKCDLLRGFEEFFEDLNPQKREQIWGSTFPEEHSPEADLSEIFMKEAESLYEILLNRRFTRLEKEANGAANRDIFVFPHVFAAQLNKLAFFTHKLFQPNRFQVSPVFRGFYFTSGTQGGPAIDPVIQEISQRFDLSQEISNRPESSRNERKSYFIKDLFARVIIPDQILVEKKNRKRLAPRHIAGIAGCTLLLLLLVFSTSRAYLQSKENLSSLESTIGKIRKVQITEHIDPWHYRQLNELQDQIGRLEYLHHKPASFTWGLHRNRKVLIPARLLYHQKAGLFVKQFLYPELLRRSRQSRDRLDYSKAAALLGAEMPELKDHATQELLKNRLIAVLQEQNFPADLKPLLENQTRFFVDNLGNLLNTGIHAEKLRLIP